MYERGRREERKKKKEKKKEEEREVLLKIESRPTMAYKFQI